MCCRQTTRCAAAGVAGTQRAKPSLPPLQGTAQSTLHMCPALDCPTGGTYRSQDPADTDHQPVIMSGHASTAVRCATQPATDVMTSSVNRCPRPEDQSAYQEGSLRQPSGCVACAKTVMTGLCVRNAMRSSVPPLPVKTGKSMLGRDAAAGTARVQQGRTESAASEP